MSRAGVIVSRVDVVSYAVVLKYYLETGIPIKSRSDLIGTAIEHLAGIITKTGKGTQFDTMEDALTFLTQFGHDFFSQKHKQTLLKQLQDETILNEEFNLTIDKPITKRDVARSVAKTVDEKPSEESIKEELAIKPQIVKGESNEQ